MLIDNSVYNITKQSDNKHHLYAAQVRQLYILAPIGFAATLVNSSIFTYIQWSVIEHYRLILWFICLAVVTLFRYILVHAYKHTDTAGENPYLWGNRLIRGIGLSGMIWGAGAIFIFPENSIHHQAFLAFVLGGMAAGAAAAYSAIRRAFLAYTLPSLIPITVHFFLIGDDIHIAMGGMILIFTVLIIIISFRIHSITVTSLKLNFNNSELVSYLISTKKEVKGYNKKLQFEVIKREKAEKELESHRQYLEHVVKKRTSELSMINKQLTHEVKERKKSEEKLLLSHKAIQNTNEGIIITDHTRKIISVNKAFTHITGYSFRDAIGKRPGILKSGRHNQEFYQKMWESIERSGKWQGEVWNRRRNGEVYPQWMNINAIKNNQGILTNYVAVFSDITAVKQSEKRLEYLATHDPLTHLPNRFLFNDRLNHALNHAERHNAKVALLYLDLDNFKYINDNFGHCVGDQLLQTVADKLKACVRLEDTVARIGGDEFTIIIENIFDPAYIVRIVCRILDTLSKVISLDGHKIFTSASIGISFYPDHGKDGYSLIQNADTAMYQAKNQGRNSYQFYDLQILTCAC